MRELAETFVAARPTGACVQTRLHVNDVDDAVLWQVGRHLGSLAGTDLARRCADGKRSDRTPRKRDLTAESSSRWAGAITRVSNDQWSLQRRNQTAQKQNLRRAIATIERRATVPVGEKHGKVRGYRSVGERRAKLQRRDLLTARLDRLNSDLSIGKISIVRGGRRLLHNRHHLDVTNLTEDQWRERWESERLFITADGESDATLGNQTIRWNPEDGSLEIKLPKPLEHLANAPFGRYKLSCDAQFRYRGDEVAAQTETGAIRYDITYDPNKQRWYLNASWSYEPAPLPLLETLQTQRTFAVDLNVDHVAGWVVDPNGNPVGQPYTFTVPTGGTASHRDAQVRHLVSRILHTAAKHGCASVTIENLNFTAAVGKDNPKHRRGKSGRNFRGKVAGMPTGKLRDRLTQMSANFGIAIVVVDPAYTSRWAKPRIKQLAKQTSDRTKITGHHGAAVMVGRRTYGLDLARAVHRPDVSPEDDMSAAVAAATVTGSEGTSVSHHLEPLMVGPGP